MSDCIERYEQHREDVRNGIADTDEPATPPSAQQESRSVQRRVALQKGEPMPTFEAQKQEGLEAEQLAKLFHETYERFAPQFGYETREESRKEWQNVPWRNRQLMIAVAKEILAIRSLRPSPEQAPATKEKL